MLFRTLLRANFLQICKRKYDIVPPKKMTGGTPEVRSDKSLTLLTFGPMDQWTNGPMDQWTNGPMDQWYNGAIRPLHHK